MEDTAIVDEIALALESRGYANMTNGKDIGALLDRLQSLEDAKAAAPHHHSPSTMHMGDCSICGNTEDAPQHFDWKAEYAALVSMLAPFAAAADKADTKVAEIERMGMGRLSDNASTGLGITFGHLRAVRAAISGALPVPRKPGQPLQVEVAGGRLTISIGIGTLAFAVQHAENRWPKDIFISDPYEFAKDVSRMLLKEAEDGTTAVHLLLDKAAVDATDQGSEGAEYGSVSKGIEIARSLMEKGKR